MTEKETITYLTTSNGLRIVHRQIDAAAEYCGIDVNAGSRDEQRGIYGIAHFIEHTIFKGTTRHSPSYILNCMEEVGGELNAFTNKEETVIYSIFPTGHLKRACDLIGELVTKSVFPEEELRKEREVIIDEILSYRDTPSEAVYDDFDELIFKGSSLGHNILGTERSVRNITSDDSREFLKSFYTARNMVFFYLGPTPAETVLEAVEHGFSSLRDVAAPNRRMRPRPTLPFNVNRDSGHHQCHTILGTRIPGIASPDRTALALLNNIIGGPGMNARLNVALREKEGLVYTIESALSLYSDCGLFSIYFGCDHEDIARCRQLIDIELRRIQHHHIGEKALEAAKRQYIGQLIVASENHESDAQAMGHAMLVKGRVRTQAETISLINSVTVDDISRVASLISPERLSSLTLS